MTPPFIPVPHRADCGLCRRLAEGKANYLGQPVTEIVSPVCEACQLHHWPDDPRCPVMKVSRSTCPKCRVNKRELQHILQAFSTDRQTYAPYCASCLVEEGFVKHEMGVGDGVLTWWEKPLTAEEEARVSARDVFEKPGERSRPTVSPYTRGKRGLRV